MPGAGGQVQRRRSAGYSIPYGTCLAAVGGLQRRRRKNGHHLPAATADSAQERSVGRRQDCEQRKPRHVRGFKWIEGGKVQRDKISGPPKDSLKREACNPKKIE